MPDQLFLGRASIERRCEQHVVIADFPGHGCLFDHLAGGGCVGSGDQYFVVVGKILYELQNCAALFGGLTEVFAGGPVGHPAGDPRLAEVVQ